MIPSYKIFFCGMLSGGALILAFASIMIHGTVQFPALGLIAGGFLAMWGGLKTAERSIDLIYQMRKQITALTAGCRSAALTGKE